MNIDTVTLNEHFDALEIIDQTLLPEKLEVVSLRTTEEIYDAIKKLRVRGAPAIGVAAAGGAYLSALDLAMQFFEPRGAASERPSEEVVPEYWGKHDDRKAAFLDGYRKASAYLASARPTAANLMWALDRMDAVVAANMAADSFEIVELLRIEADKIKQEDISVCRAIGEQGLKLLKSGMTILTHCNAGRLAAVRYGTALAPIYVGQEKGYDFKVFADETRPLLQGARLTSFELKDSGIDVTLICDSTVATVMKSGKIDVVITGCDRVAANGDAANKIGTAGIAILAKHFGIPFYIAAPKSTIDMGCGSGAEIVIEERAPEEVSKMWYAHAMAPDGVKIFNPAFDVTDNELITAIITEKGIIRPPYTSSLAELFRKI